MNYVPPCFWFDDNMTFGISNYTSNATGYNIFEHVTIESIVIDVLISAIIAWIVILLEIYFSSVNRR